MSKEGQRSPRKLRMHALPKKAASFWPWWIVARRERGLWIAISSDFSREAGKLDFFLKHLNFQMLAQFSSLNPM